jgi:maltose O-acetyltransferase
VPSEKEKMLAGEPYDPSDPDLVAERERARRLTERFNDADANDAERRRELLDELFGSVGERVTVEPPFRCDYGYNVRVGDDFFVTSTACFSTSAGSSSATSACSAPASTSTPRPTQPIRSSERRGPSTGRR